ncbi:Flavin mononucleotide hydrolase 1, chloroplatic [Sesamum angolense]|uniref:Flavin mononucleotide hydrolase 1, chloroplatic n=1 Tax=Sesamum angolense TaxID=2727404 RepID=A0AAE1W2U8_9LAMI|nr:Flavin mononucleotide hydrolase 1, chloroplatic [Sesamum angolense]
MAAQRLVGRFSSSPMVKLEQRPPSTVSQYSTIKKEMSFSLSTTTAGSSVNSSKPSRKLPVLLFDIMDTIVRDPFYHDVPAFFGMSMKELLECKHPTAWIEFEKGLINETSGGIMIQQGTPKTYSYILNSRNYFFQMELARTFFKDGRPIDLEGLKSCMRRGYSYIEGVEALLIDLKKSGYEMHAFTNYPIWYEIIEEKLKLSTYLSWTFCSCIMGKRKPDPNLYMDILKHLKIEPACCIFIDDRLSQVTFYGDKPVYWISTENTAGVLFHVHFLSVQFMIWVNKLMNDQMDLSCTTVLQCDSKRNSRHGMVKIWRHQSMVEALAFIFWNNQSPVEALVSVAPKDTALMNEGLRQRMKNVEAALDAGFTGIQFKNVDSLRSDLGRLGILMETI